MVKVDRILVAVLVVATVGCGPSKEATDLHDAMMRPPPKAAIVPPLNTIPAKPGMSQAMTVKQMLSHR